MHCKRGAVRRGLKERVRLEERARLEEGVRLEERGMTGRDGEANQRLSALTRVRRQLKKSIVVFSGSVQPTLQQLSTGPKKIITPIPGAQPGCAPLALQKATALAS